MLAFCPARIDTSINAALSWGIQTYRVPHECITFLDDMVWLIDQSVQSSLADIGDQLVIVAGMPPGMR